MSDQVILRLWTSPEERRLTEEYRRLAGSVV
jgi:hypothetical protein